MSTEFFTGAERILSATANGVYQGVLVTILAALALRFLARTNAATRHAVWFATLLFVAGLIPAHLLLSLRSRPATQSPAGDSVLISAGPSTSLAEPVNQGPVTEPDNADCQPEEFDLVNIESVPSFTTSAARKEQPGTEPASLDQTSVTTKIKAWLIPMYIRLRTSASHFESAISLPHWACASLVLAWALFAGARAGLLAGRLNELRRVKELSEAAGPRMQAIFNRLRNSLVTRRNVELRISSVHRNAVLLGFAHPVVLLPSHMENDASDGELEHVLRHELAHVERRDDWSNLTQQVVQAALFFHPAVWWISSKLSLEREIACDDHVIEASGRPRAYALTLANFAARMNRADHLLAPGVSNNNSHLQQRINMILNTKRDRSPRLARIRLGFLTTATAIIAVLAMNALPRLVLAQQPAAPSVAGTTAAEPGYAVLASPQGESIVATAPPSGAPATIAVGTAPASALPGTTAIETTPAVGVSTWIAVRPDPAPVTILTAPTPQVSTMALAGQPGMPSYAVATPSPIGSTIALAGQPGVMKYGADSSAGFGGDWSDDESRPRYKPDLPSEDSAPDAPAPPAPPAPAARPAAPMGVMPPGRPGRKRLSVEERLDRIERILEDLEARGNINGNRRGGDFGYKVLPDGKSYYGIAPNPGADLAPKRADEARAGADQAMAAEIEMKRAMEMAQRAAEKARRDMDKLKTKDLAKLQEEMRAAESENSEKALDALRDARETLRSQMQTLEQQIKRMEADRRGLNKPLRDSGSDDEPRSKPVPETR